MSHPSTAASVPRASGSRAAGVAAASGVALALAALAAAAAFAAYRGAAAGSAEAGYLGILAAVVLAAAAVAPRPRLETAAGAVLVVTAIWTLPAGPGRGAVVGLVLVAVLVAAALRQLGGRAAAAGREELAAILPLSLGAQTLLRGGRWLAPVLDPRPLASLAALPVAGGVAAWSLTRRHPPGLALLAAVTALLPGPGLNAASTLSLVALAAGSEAFRRDLPRPGRLAALAVLAAPVIWEPRTALVAAAAGLALGGTVPALAAAAAGLVLALAAPVRSWPEALGLLAWVPILLPALLLPARERWPRLTAAVALALAAARSAPEAAVLAAPLGLAALSLPPAGALAAAQRVWSGALFAGTALLAAYPWLRQAPLADALGLLGLRPGWSAALALLAAAGVMALVARLPGGAAGRRTAAVTACALVAALWAGLPAGRVLVEGDPVVVSRERPRRSLFIDPRPVSQVVFDSHLVHGAGLPRGTPVATFRLRDAAGTVYEHPVRTGEETGEWAARRPDVALLPGLAAPPRWRVQVDPGGQFFAQFYRARWRLPEPFQPVHVEVERAPGLPQELVLLLFRVELRP